MLRGSGLAILLLMAGAGYSQQTRKPNLSGNWKLDLAHSELDEKIGGIQLAIEQKADQTVHLVETEVEPNGRESKIEFTCSRGGKECPLEVVHIEPQKKTEKLLFSKG